MKLQGLILLALFGGLFFARIPEANAITSCSVCADGTHPCTFRCYTGSYDFPFVTTCKGAGYRCVRGFPVTGADADGGTAATESACEDTTLVDNFYRLAALETRGPTRACVLNG